MTIKTRELGLLLVLAAGLLGCGGSLNHGGGPDASTTLPCAAMGACECMAASDRCEARTEACWCPSECNPNIACICGGGRFLSCQDRTAAMSCDDQVTRVKALCSDNVFAGNIDGLCGANPTCVAGCLSQLTTTQSCAQIDCGFCTACDCAPPTMPSALRACLFTCAMVTPLAETR